MCKYLDCISCVLKQATDAIHQAGLGSDLQINIINRILLALSETNPAEGSSIMIQKVFKIIREQSGSNDPLENVKSCCLDIALRAYPELKHAVNESNDRLETAVRIALAGNIIDHDTKEKLGNLALFRRVEAALSRPLSIDHISQFKENISKANNILYIADNAGEF